MKGAANRNLDVALFAVVALICQAALVRQNRKSKAKEVKVSF